MPQTPDLSDAVKNYINEEIEYLQSGYEMALTKDEEKPYDGELVKMYNNKSFSTWTALKVYLGKPQAATLRLLQSPNGTSTSMSFNNTNAGVFYNVLERWEGVDADKIAISYEQAKKDGGGYDIVSWRRGKGVLLFTSHILRMMWIHLPAIQRRRQPRLTFSDLQGAITELL